MSRFKVAGVFLAVLMTTTVFTPTTILAASTSAHLGIYPANCIFEYINDGTHNIRYITPQECGQQLGPPNIGIAQPIPDISVLPSPTGRMDGPPDLPVQNSPLVAALISLSLPVAAGASVIMLAVVSVIAIFGDSIMLWTRMIKNRLLLLARLLLSLLRRVL